MADNSTLNNIRPDQWDLTIGGDTAPFHASIKLPIDLDVHHVKTMRHGSDTVKSLLMGRSFDFEVTLQQMTDAELKRFLDLTGVSVPFLLQTVGSAVPTRAVRLHDPTAGDANGDIIIPAVSFKGIAHDADGAGERTFTVKCHAERDPSTGRVLYVGPT